MLPCLVDGFGGEAEAFHMNCEIHTTIMHPLEPVNLHVCAAVPNNSYFELLTPVDAFAFGLKEPLPIEDGIATFPTGPGLGIDFDRDFIDRATYKLL
ncbi:MAG: enolase C-terminal domain-like protein [Alphaproteobacteria bacterium]